MTPADDDARPIPQRRPPRRDELEWDDAWTVDTRSGGQAAPPGSAAPTARPAGGPGPRGPRPPVSARPGSSRAPQQRVPHGAGTPRTGSAPPPGVVPPGARPAGAQRPGAQPPGGPAGHSPQPGRGGPPPGRGPVPTAPRRRRRGRVALRWFVLLLLAYLAFEVYAPIDAWRGVTRVDSVPAGDRPAGGDGHNYLLVGSDSREGLTAAERKKLGTGSDVGQRTDSIIVVHVPSSGGKASMISIPRDSYVPIPGHGSNKINAAFAIGGPKLLIETVEQVTDLRFDGYLEIGFGGFAQLVDSMGGVDICVPFDMDDPKAHINLKKGCQTLDGKNALGFVRARYSDPRGDIGRAQRQRQFLAAIMKEMVTPSTVLVPWTWWNTSHAAVAGLTVGDDTSILDAYRIMQTMRGASSGDTLSLVVPLASLDFQTNAGSSVKWDTAKARSLFQMLNDGTPINTPPPGTDGKPSGATG